MKLSRKLLGAILLSGATGLLAVSLRAQTAAAADYGSFTVGGVSSSYYAVQFVNNLTSYDAPNGSNTSDLVIYRSDTHENGSWYGTFNLVISFHPSNWGHFSGEIEKVVYQTGSGSPYNDPVGDIQDGSLASGGDDLIVWLKGGATYHWRNRETTAGWSLAKGNSSGGSIVDSSGFTRSPISSQSSLVASAKNNFYVDALGIGTPNNLTVGGKITFGDGTQQATAWTGTVCGGDYAESVNAAGKHNLYAPGDVLVLTGDGKGDVEKSSEPYSTMVAGIYAAKPGVVGRRISLPKTADDLPMAMVGIVPTKVSTENGPIRRGDLLVSSSTPGYAMKGTDRSRMLGAVVGKAMGSLESGKGTIEVLVTLQ